MAAGPLHVTLTANTVAPLTIDVIAARQENLSFANAPTSKVRVTNVTGAAAVYFTVNGVDPTVAGAGCYVLPASMCSLVLPVVGSSPTVKLISAGTPGVAVWDAT